MNIYIYISLSLSQSHRFESQQRQSARRPWVGENWHWNWQFDDWNLTAITTRSKNIEILVHAKSYAGFWSRMRDLELSTWIRLKIAQLSLLWDIWLFLKNPPDLNPTDLNPKTRSVIAIFPHFLTSNLHFVRKGCAGHFKVAIFPQFLTSNVHFVWKGCDGQSKIAIFLSFWRPTSISCERVAFRGALVAPPPP